MESFWTWFGRVDNIAGMAGAIISLFTLILVWRQSRRMRDLARQWPKVENFAELRKIHDGIKSSAPVAFALSLIPTADSIKSQVETFLRVQDWKMPIGELNLNGINNPEVLESFINALREKRRYFQACGFTDTLASRTISSSKG